MDGERQLDVLGADRLVEQLVDGSLPFQSPARFLSMDRPYVSGAAGVLRHGVNAGIKDRIRTCG